jgi:hypothetical protein
MSHPALRSRPDSSSPGRHITLGIAIPGTPFTTHASQPDALRDFGVEFRHFHVEGDQTFTVLERWAFLTKMNVSAASIAR